MSLALDFCQQYNLVEIVCIYEVSSNSLEYVLTILSDRFFFLGRLWHGKIPVSFRCEQAICADQKLFSVSAQNTTVEVVCEAGTYMWLSTFIPGNLVMQVSVVFLENALMMLRKI